MLRLQSMTIMAHRLYCTDVFGFLMYNSLAVMTPAAVDFCLTSLTELNVLMLFTPWQMSL